MPVALATRKKYVQHTKEMRKKIYIKIQKKVWQQRITIIIELDILMVLSPNNNKSA